jgi:hypothetical protein
VVFMGRFENLEATKKLKGSVWFWTIRQYLVVFKTEVSKNSGTFVTI